MLMELLVGALYFVGAAGAIALILGLIVWGEDYDE
jgi:hypothetical protein